jgi:retron-type reverse transcriptase
MAFFALKRDAASGVDGLTWPTYEADLERNLNDLHERVHRRALPSRRVYIPKPDGRQRPLAVAALEDKIVQRATAAVLNAIYEEDFLGFSYGFRPGRGAHDALDALMVALKSRKVNFIVDADIRSFFDTVSQEWLIRFLEHRIGDKRIIRLVQKWLGQSDQGCRAFGVEPEYIAQEGALSRHQVDAFGELTQPRLISSRYNRNFCGGGCC